MSRECNSSREKRNTYRVTVGKTEKNTIKKTKK
jgi:hypothetical protein